MLFNIVLFAMVAAIAYFHYTQGLFSSAMSAILSIIAAMVAIGYHETVASYVIQYLKMPEDADAISLIAVYAAAYGIGRLLFDRLSPGNIRFPLMMDKIGAGAFGVVAGVFATGIVALAAESMPFGPSFGGYSRGVLQDRANVTILNAGNNGRAADSAITDELASDSSFQSIPVQSLWLHQNDLVLGLASQISAGGALSNGTPLATVHPDYEMELFGQRLGNPGGTRKLAVGSDKQQPVRVSKAFALAKVPPHMDAETKAVRGDHQLPDISAEMTLAVLRVEFQSGAGLTDTTDSHLRISPAGIRLKAGTTDYFPLGTMAGGTLLLQNRADDPLVIDLNSSQTVDFLFAVNPDDINTETKDKEKVRRFKQGTFLEVMRYAQADLGGMELSSDSPAVPVQVADKSETLSGVLRKVDVMQDAMKKLSVSASPSSPQSSDAGSNKPAQAPPAPAKPDPLQEAPGRFLGL